MTTAIRPPLVRAVFSSALTVVLSTILLLTAPLAADAAPNRAKTITRDRVLARAKNWVEKRVPYSQRAYHRGYRQDCSGFVSMAWATGRSYTTRSLDAVSRRVSQRHARPGDAVLTPGHVVIFAKWKNRKAKTFYAYEQTTWGGHAVRKVRRMTASARVLRRDGIRTQPKIRVAASPSDGVKRLGTPEAPAVVASSKPFKLGIRASSERETTVAVPNAYRPVAVCTASVT